MENDDDLFRTFVKGRVIPGEPVNPNLSIDPTQKMTPFKRDTDLGGVRLRRKEVAQDRAVIWMYEQIYRHKMRYDPRAIASELDLNEQDIIDIEKYYKQDEESQMNFRMVTVSLSAEAFEEYSEWYAERARRASQRAFVGKCHYTLEWGDNGEGTHPHYHFVFETAVKWLAKSRIIDEYSKIFQLDKNFIHVKPITKVGYKECLSYINKEKGCKVLTNFRRRATDDKEA